MTFNTFNPAVEAARVYHREECARTFEEDLFLHLAHGYVLSTPKAFLMGRAVNHDAPYEKIIDPKIAFENPDAWWVWLAAGPLAEILGMEPYPLPFIGWEVRNVPRFHRRERLLNHVAPNTRIHLRGGPVLQRRRQEA